MKQNIKKLTSTILIVLTLFCACIGTYTRTFAIPIYADNNVVDDSKYYSAITSYLGYLGITLQPSNRQILYGAIDKIVGDFIDSDHNLTELGRTQIYNDVVSNVAISTIQNVGSRVSGLGYVISASSVFFPNFYNYLKASFNEWSNGSYNVGTQATITIDGYTYPLCISNDGRSVSTFSGFITTPYFFYGHYVRGDLANTAVNIGNRTLTASAVSTGFGDILKGYYYSSNGLGRVGAQSLDDIENMFGTIILYINGDYRLECYNPFTNERNYGENIRGEISGLNNNIHTLTATRSGSQPTYDNSTNYVVNNSNEEQETFTTDDVIQEALDDTLDYTNNDEGGGSGGSSSDDDGDDSGQGSWLGSALNFLTNLINTILNKITDFLSNIAENLTLPDLKNKFPFSIPFDLISFFSVLNATPETPELNGSINLGIYTWNIDYDLHQFDNIASLCRNLEFIAFSIGLILITRTIIK